MTSRKTAEHVVLGSLGEVTKKNRLVEIDVRPRGPRALDEIAERSLELRRLRSVLDDRAKDGAPFHPSTIICLRSMPDCPNDEELEHFVEGRLAGAELAAVEEHLATCDACRRVVAGALAAALEPDDVGDEESPARRGTVLGRYVLLEAIGAGAMGVVYRAYDPELDRRLAVKVLRRADASDKQRERMLREAKAMAKVSSPYVVAVYDAGVVEDHVFIAMELVDGVTLANWISKSARDARDVVARFVQAGRGLVAAHEAGLIHRDFKPENVLVTKENVAKVTDFGLARGLHASVTVDASHAGAEPLALTLSRTGSLAGTPAYMAPEQLLGNPTDERVDQFSFCVALYEALVGKRPFGGDTLESLRATVLAGKVDEALRLRAVPAQLRRAMLRGLSVDPGARFPSMRDLVAALESYASSPRRRWLAVAAISTAAALVVAARAELGPRRACAAVGSAADGIWNESTQSAVKRAFLSTNRAYAADAFRTTDLAMTAYANEWRAQRTENCEATRSRAEQSEELFDLRVGCLDQKMAEVSALVHALSSADALTVDHAVEAVSSLSPLAACKDTAALRARVRLPGDAAAKAKVASLGVSLEEARALGASGRYTDAHARVTDMMPSVRDVSYAPLTAEALLLDGDVLERGGYYKQAATTLRAAAWTAIAARDDATATAAMVRLIDVTGYRLASNDEANLWDHTAEAELLARGNPVAGRIALEESRGSLARAQGHYEDARRHLQSALDMQRQLGKKDDPDVASILADLGYTLRLFGDREGSRVALVECVDIRTRVFGAAHPLVASAKSLLGAVYTSQDRLEDAMAVLLEAMQVQEATLGRDHVETGYTLNRVGDVQLSRGDFALARDTHVRVLDLGVKALGPAHPEVGLAHMNLAIDLEELGDLDGAERQVVESKRILEAALGPNYPYLASVLTVEGAIRRDQHRFAEAKVIHVQALALAEKTLGPKHVELSFELVNLGMDLIALHANAEAVTHLERALALTDMGAALSADVAEVKFALAQALWSDAPSRSRARQLAQEAKALYRYDSMRDVGERARIDAWLAAHSP